MVTISGIPTVTGTFNYTVTLTGGCGIATATGTITVNPLPTPVITGPATACANSTGNVYSTPNVGGDTYVWAISGGVITAGAGTNSITVTWGAAGSGWVQVTETITATTCAVTTAHYNVTINPLPPCYKRTYCSLCQLNRQYYSTPNVGGDTYVWAISGGVITAGAGTNSITVTWGTAGLRLGTGHPDRHGYYLCRYYRTI